MPIQVPITEKNQENKQITQEHKKDYQINITQIHLERYAKNTFNPDLKFSDTNRRELIKALKDIQELVEKSPIPGEKQNV